MPEYNIKVQFEQKTFSFLCSEDQDIISAAKMNGIDLPSSCCSGVCTDCASMILEGSVDQEDAMGLNDDLREFIITNLEKKGDLIRWSIFDIQNSIDSFGTKKLKIKAVIAN